MFKLLEDWIYREDQMRYIKQRIEKLEAKFKEQEEWKPKPQTLEQELMELNEIMEYFHPEHNWCNLPFEEQKRILTREFPVACHRVTL